MNNLIKKSNLLFGLFLLLIPSMLYAAKQVSALKGEAEKVDYIIQLSRAKRRLLVDAYSKLQHIPNDVLLLITYFLQDNPLQYKNKPLPSDLSGKDLSQYDFTGCQFTYTDLTDTNLKNVILFNTTCDYQKAFQENKNQLKAGSLYQKKIVKDLQSIAQVYPTLNNHAHKAKLLQIACAISRLPFCTEEAELYVQVAYWSCELLQLKQLLDDSSTQPLCCSLEKDLEWDLNNYCWSTNYPQDKVSINDKQSHDNFPTYIKEFKNGLVKYQCKSVHPSGLDWYKNNITKNIQGLQKAYPAVKDPQLQQEARNIAHALSKSYQIQQRPFLFHYLFYQNRLIRFKKSMSLELQPTIHYSYKNIVYWF